jgi:hypothetical protein
MKVLVRILSIFGGNDQGGGSITILDEEGNPLLDEDGSSLFEE